MTQNTYTSLDLREYFGLTKYQLQHWSSKAQYKKNQFSLVPIVVGRGKKQSLYSQYQFDLLHEYFGIKCKLIGLNEKIKKSHLRGHIK